MMEILNIIKEIVGIMLYSDESNRKLGLEDRDTTRTITDYKK